MLHILARFSLIGCWVLLANDAFAQRELTDIPVPDPALEQATFVLPEGFEVNLFAADPQIAKPIQMNFDPQGRLWIVSSETYPQIEPGAVQNDKVLVLQDADGDGVSDSTTVFADGLLIPTGIEPGDGGAYVGNSTQLLHFEDTDGDLKADRKRIVLSGFGTEDTHHIVHTFRWGPDAHLYFGQSIYIHSHIETPWGVERLNAGGYWRFNPDTNRLGVFMKGLINPWGLAFNDAGQAFATDGAGGEGINHLVPGAYYKTAANAPRLLEGLNPGSPKHCGLEIVDGPNLPKEFQGSQIAHDFRGHRVCRFVLNESGSGFRSRETVELIKSDHVAFRPVDVKQGPDGAIYIADWYNPIIQHGEVDFRDERRDKTHGRIWRVTYKGQTIDRTDFTKSSIDELLGKLRDGTHYERRMVRRVLRSRDRSDREAGQSTTYDAVSAYIRHLDQTVPHYWRTRLESLWFQQGAGVLDAESLDFVLRCPEADIRAGATRILADIVRGSATRNRPELLDVDAALALQVLDTNALVRLEAVRVLAESTRPTAIVDAVKAMDGGLDTNLEYGLWLTARETSSQWLPRLSSGEVTFEKPAHAVFALSAVGGPETVSPLLALLRNKQVPSESMEGALAAVTRFASPAQLSDVLGLANDSTDDDATTVMVLNALSQTAKRSKRRPNEGLGQLAAMLNRSPAVSVAAAKAIGNMGIKGLLPALFKSLSDDTTPVETKTEIIRSLVSLGEANDHNKLIAFAKETSSDRARVVVFAEMLPVRKQQISKLFLDASGEMTDVESARPFFAALASKPKTVPTFVAELKDRTIATELARLGLAVIRSSGAPSEELTKALATAGQIKAGPRTLSSEEMLALATKVTESGDPHRGEDVYRRARLTCMKCHALGGAGGIIGPELRSLGATAPIDYIVESLINPNAKVKEGYNTTLVVTAEGKVISGIKVRETDEELIVRDAEGRELGIALDDIDFEEPGQSLMPAGLVDELPENDLVDLVAFLKALGTKPEFTVEPRNLVRQWQAMEATPEAAYALRRKSYAAAASADPAFAWSPRYVSVDGSLPLSELPNVTVKNRSAKGARGIGFSRATLSVADDGPVVLSFGKSLDGLSVWIDEKPIALDAAIVEGVMLSAGEHQVTVSVDGGKREEPLLVEASRGVWLK